MKGLGGNRWVTSLTEWTTPFGPLLWRYEHILEVCYWASCHKDFHSDEVQGDILLVCLISEVIYNLQYIWMDVMGPCRIKDHMGTFGKLLQALLNTCLVQEGHVLREGEFDGVPFGVVHIVDEEGNTEVPMKNEEYGYDHA